jgi:hypothetical protein
MGGAPADGGMGFANAASDSSSSMKHVPPNLPMVGIMVTSMRAMEAGQHAPRPETLRKIAETVGVRVEDLMAKYKARHPLRSGAPLMTYRPEPNRRRPILARAHPTALEGDSALAYTAARGGTDS